MRLVSFEVGLLKHGVSYQIARSKHIHTFRNHHYRASSPTLSFVGSLPHEIIFRFFCRLLILSWLMVLIAFAVCSSPSALQ